MNDFVLPIQNIKKPQAFFSRDICAVDFAESPRNKSLTTSIISSAKI